MKCPKVHVQDTVGAGDCFVGTFAFLLAELLETHSCSELTMGDVEGIVTKCCYASSYSVQFKGGFDKFPDSVISEWNDSFVVFTVSFSNAAREELLPFATEVDKGAAELQSHHGQCAGVQGSPSPSGFQLDAA